MPLQSGSSREAIGHNIAAEEAAGKPKKQALAIALSQARRTARTPSQEPAPVRKK